ncbi:MAG: hypothetical protein KGZ37_02295 [Nitrosarchaeum sp.]|nr:hypothetical protein [Nitrosarchaeum sp.]
MSTSARAPFLGYEYQSLQALLLITPTGTNSRIYIERFDDVEFESGDEKILIQNKFSLNDSSKITAKDEAFWKSIGNWISLIESGIISEEEYHFLIITTRDTDDPLILKLTERSETRNNRELLTELIEFAEENKNKNKKTEKHIRKFLKMKIPSRISLIEKFQILVSQANIKEIQEKINSHLSEWSYEEYLDEFLNSIYGWWYREIIKRLSENINEPLTHNELVETIQHYRDRQSAKALPIYLEKLKKPEKLTAAYSDFPFVEQLEQIDLEKSSIVEAMFDYYRAYEHRSSWVRNLKQISEKLDDYDEELVEKWKSEFKSINRKIEQEKITNNNELKKLGLGLFEWMDKNPFYPNLKLERDIAKTWLLKGSYHLLSDDCRVGWHPNYKKLVGCKNEN